MDQVSKIVALQAQIVQRDQEIAKRNKRLSLAEDAYRALKTKYVAAMAPFERVARRTRTKSEVFNDQLKVEFMKRQAAGERIVIRNGEIVPAWNATH